MPFKYSQSIIKFYFFLLILEYEDFLLYLLRNVLRRHHRCNQEEQDPRCNDDAVHPRPNDAFPHHHTVDTVNGQTDRNEHQEECEEALSKIEASGRCRVTLSAIKRDQNEECQNEVRNSRKQSRFGQMHLLYRDIKKFDALDII